MSSKKRFFRYYPHKIGVKKPEFQYDNRKSLEFLDAEVLRKHCLGLFNIGLETCYEDIDAGYVFNTLYDLYSQILNKKDKINFKLFVDDFEITKDIFLKVVEERVSDCRKRIWHEKSILENLMNNLQNKFALNSNNLHYQCFEFPNDSQKYIKAYNQLTIINREKINSTNVLDVKPITPSDFRIPRKKKC